MVLLASVLGLTGAVSHRSPARKVSARSMWVWNGQRFTKPGPEQDAFFRFLAEPKGMRDAGIDVIFWDPGSLDSATDVQRFIAACHKRGIRVDYLCGEATYATREHAKDGLKHLSDVQRFDQLAPANARFDGIQFDVEPYSLPDWPSSKLRGEYIDFLKKCRSQIDSGSDRILLGAAIPRWFDGPDLDGLYKSVLQAVDYAAVMDYVDRTPAFVADGRNEVEYATQIGKKVWLGAEASRLNDEPHATFFALGNRAMEDAFHSAQAAYGNSKGFAGIAIEHYDTYVALKP